jgi:hypothetical protein
MSLVMADGASTFQGKRSGVVKQLQSNWALHVAGIHCMVSENFLFLLSSYVVLIILSFLLSLFPLHFVISYWIIYSGQ